MSECQHCQQRQQQCRVLQSDLQFEIKKIREDLAQEKVTLQLQYQKQTKKVIDRYHKERSMREEETKKWLQKYDGMVEEYQEKIVEKEKECESECESLRQTMTSQHEQESCSKQMEYEKDVMELRERHQSAVRRMLGQHEAEMIRQRQQHERKVDELKEQSQEEVAALTQSYEERIKGLKREIQAVEETMKDAKIEAHQKQTALYQELFHRKQEISSLKYEMGKLEETIATNQKEIHYKQLEIEMVKQEHEAQLTKMKGKFEEERLELVSEFEGQIEVLLQSRMNDCVQFEAVVKEIEERREVERELHQSSLEEVRVLVAERPSREEDLHQITKLQELLTQKEREMKKVVEEARDYKLQLNNKEQTWTKIFRGSQNPLNIQKIGKVKRDLRLSRPSSSLMKDLKNYNSLGSPMAATSTGDFGKHNRLRLESKSSKVF